MNHDLTALAGRVLLAALFFTSGIGKAMGFAGTAGYIASKGLPLPEVLTVLTIVVEVGAGAALALGWKARWAALALALFTVPATLLFHNYWAMPAEQQQVQSIMFWKNLSIIGGLLMVWSFGPGRLALEKR